EDLRLAPREDRRAVRLRQHAGLDPDGPDLVGATAVRAGVVLDDHAPQLALLGLVEGGLQLVYAVRGALRRWVRYVAGDYRVTQRLHGVRPVVLALRQPPLPQTGGTGRGRDVFGERGVQLGRRGERPLRQADVLAHALDELDDRGELALRELYGPHHDVLRELVRGSLDHEHGVRGGSYRQLQLAAVLVQYLHAGVGDVLTVHVAHAATRRGAVPRDVGDRQRRRRTDRSERRGVVDLICREHGRDDLDLVTELLGEERPDLPVYEARVQRGLGARPALATHERAGDLPDGVVALLVLDGQREERHGRRSVAHGGGDEHQRVPVA